MEYKVTWTIDIEARTPREAAKKALAIQRKADSIATVFEVAYMRGRKTTGHKVERYRRDTIDLGYNA